MEVQENLRILYSLSKTQELGVSTVRKVCRYKFGSIAMSGGQHPAGRKFQGEDVTSTTDQRG